MSHLFLSIVFLVFSSFAQASEVEQSPSGLPVEDLIAKGQAESSLSASLLAISESLVGTPYLLGNAGEGNLDVYDQDPLWRLDVQDCTTYVETVMALALARDRGEFFHQLALIRYDDGRVAYTARKHFAESDWLPNNERAGYVRDITAHLFPHFKRISSVVIDKTAWYSRKTANDIEPRSRDLTERERLAAALRDQAGQFKPQPANIPYLPMQAFYKAGTIEPNPEVLRKIPSGTIFNIVREDWKPGGIAMAISHQGFLLQKADGTYMRHASPSGGVIEDRIDVYFQKFWQSPTVRGINILQVRDPR